MASLVSKLPEHEKKALALCGITQDSQLKGIGIEALLADLHKAQKFFPEEASYLSDNRLREIHEMVCGESPEPESVPERHEQKIAQEEKLETATVIRGATTVTPTRSYPTLAPRRHQHRSGRRSNTTPEQMRQAPGRAHSVHCSRPIGTYIAALSMVLFYIGLIGMLMIPVLLFMGFIDEGQIVKSFAFAALALIPYALHGAWAPCAVCNMRFFVLRHYNINRHAHKFPIVGWTTLATALHLIFFLWYRCPACGTSLRLFRHRH